MEKRILSISYDVSLLINRAELLKQSGYSVVSADTFEKALRSCTEEKYDLVIVGHSVPINDKKALIDAITENCRVPIIDLVRTRDLSIEGCCRFG